MDCAVEVAKAKGFWLGKPAGKPKMAVWNLGFLRIF